MNEWVIQEQMSKDRRGHTSLCTYIYIYIYTCTNIGLTYCVTVCIPHVAYLQHSQVLYSVGPNYIHFIVVYPPDVVKDVVAENRAQLLNNIWKILGWFVKFR